MRVSLLLVACASAQVHHKFHDGKRLVTAKYPTLAAATEWKAASETCPVRCQWDGRKVRTEHLLKHGKMIEWIPGASPDENINRIYHKCWHEAKTGVCSCECAHWDVDDCDVGSQVCPTACGQSASTLTGTPASVEDIGCFYGSDQLNDNQCLASDKPSTCTIECPATVACPTSSPTPAPTSVPTTAAPTKAPTPQGYIFDNFSLRVAVELWCNPATEQEARAKYGDISTWDTGRVTNMGATPHQNRDRWHYAGGLFANHEHLKSYKVGQNCNPVGIGNWDTSNVKSMKGMFFGNLEFNQPIGDWDVSKVTDFTYMFSAREQPRATKFNQPIGNWDVSKVTKFVGMFSKSSFNQPIGDWDVSKVTDFTYMFSAREQLRATKFNQPIGNWDVSKVTKFGGMFQRSLFNQPIGDWDVSSGTDFSSMFRTEKGGWSAPAQECYLSGFNQPIGNWDMSKAVNLANMFLDNSFFNQDIGKWDVSRVYNFRGMFASEMCQSAFNQDISNWNVYSGAIFTSMFDGNVKFNQPIGKWNIAYSGPSRFPQGNPRTFNLMFSNALSFKQDLSSWDLSRMSLRAKNSMFTDYRPYLHHHDSQWFKGAPSTSMIASYKPIGCEHYGNYPCW